MAAPRVALRDLHKSFGRLRVLRAIDLEVEAGQVVCVIGPSGSGKSTMLRCINRLEEPTAGRVEIDGTDITDPSVDVDHMRQRVGMVFQGLNLFPHMSALGNVTVALRKVKRMNREQAEETGLASLDNVGLAHKAGVRPAQLSGGQQQRVAIARALAMDPEVMLFDEVTSGLDPELINDVLDAMRDLAHGGMTMIAVTHRMGFAREVAHRLVFMDEGSIVEDGLPAKLFDEPRTERLRTFLSRVL